MVLFFTSTEGYVMYMGADKYENEDLIKYGLPEDMWFHVDDMSSAHVYLRLNKEQRLEDVSDNTINECAQLVKANSIEGCKKKEVYVVYTRWRNLKKTNDMEIGAIGYHDKSKVRRIKVEKNKEIINIINKTKIEHFPNLLLLQQERSIEYNNKLKEEKRKQYMIEKQVKLDREENARIRNYSSVMTMDNMTANTEFEATVDDSAAKDFEDDFM